MRIQIYGGPVDGTDGTLDDATYKLALGSTFIIPTVHGTKIIHQIKHVRADGTLEAHFLREEKLVSHV